MLREPPVRGGHEQVATSQSQRRGARGISSVMNVCAPLIFLLLIMTVWTLATTVFSLEPWRLPSPAQVFQRAQVLLTQPWMWQRVLITAGEAVLGCATGALVALPLAYAIYKVNWFRAAVEPFLGATQAIPAIALAPLLVLWVGFGLAPVIALCAIMVFFPILVSTVVGLRHLDQDVLEAASLDGASGWIMLRQIEAPMAAPSILAGLRNGFTLSVTGAVVGEMVMGGNGMGGILVQQRQNMDTPGMFVSIIVLCVLAMSIYIVIYRIEKRYNRS